MRDIITVICSSKLMAHPVWPSDLTDFSAIGTTGYSGTDFTHPNTTHEGGGWVAGSLLHASSGMFDTSQHDFDRVTRGSSCGMMGADGFGDGIGEYAVAPEGFAFPPSALPVAVNTPPTSSGDIASTHKSATFVSINESQSSQSVFMVPTPSAVSDHSDASMSSSSGSDHSGSPYPSPGPQAYTSLAQSNNYVAEPLIPASTVYYSDYFANSTESLCLFNDIQAQYYPSPISPTSSSSPVPTTSVSTPIQVVANYSGPIRNHIVNMSTDENGVVWIVFPYSKNKEVKNHTIRCDVDKVPPSALRDDIKTVAAAVLTLTSSLIQGISYGRWNHSWRT